MARQLRCHLSFRDHAPTRDRISHTLDNARQKDAPEDAMNLVTYLRSLVREDKGQDLLEYALLIALIALVAVGAITTAGTNVSTTFTNIANKIIPG
jgi:pilus assembly protein Flp/PilA